MNLTVDVADHDVTCLFLNGPVTSATCTIQYGTDPAYVNLPNTDSSTGTNVNSLTVPLSTPLQANTLYYYVVSSMGVLVQGTFHSGVYHLSYGIGDKVNMYLVLKSAYVHVLVFQQSITLQVFVCYFSSCFFKQLTHEVSVSIIIITERLATCLRIFQCEIIH